MITTIVVVVVSLTGHFAGHGVRRPCSCHQARPLLENIITVFYETLRLKTDILVCYATSTG
jgi:hypothetical protein